MIKTTLPRFQPMHSWTNRLLRVDLSSGRIWAEETAPRVPAFLGARGLAASILWDEYPKPVNPLDERMLPYFACDENWVDVDRFRPVVDHHGEPEGIGGGDCRSD